MKFYRHYKNKPYKYLGIAKHSETLEDLVLYECRYDNPTATLWVRPKEMFFSDVQIDGRSKPRFEKVPIAIEATTEIGEKQIDIIAPILKNVMGEWDPDWFRGTVRSHKFFHMGVAMVDDKPVGFKLGYELDHHTFYSWLGAILPEYRGLGLASLLMEEQHNWCRKQGYRKVQTKTQNRYKEMLQLNLKHGFDVIGTQAYEHKGGMKIVLEKTL